VQHLTYVTEVEVLNFIGIPLFSARPLDIMGSIVAVRATFAQSAPAGPGGVGRFGAAR